MNIETKYFTQKHFVCKGPLYHNLPPSIAVQMPLPWSLLRDQIFIEASASCCVLHISSYFIISSHFIIFHRSSICYDFPHLNRISTSPIPSSCNTVASMILDVGKRQAGFHAKFGKDMDKRIISWYILNLNVQYCTIVLVLWIRTSQGCYTLSRSRTAVMRPL